jgi:hypothetical protein
MDHSRIVPKGYSQSLKRSSNMFISIITEIVKCKNINCTHKYHHFVILHYFLQTVFILLIPSFTSIITLKCIQVMVCYYCFYKSHNFHPNFVYKATIYFKYYFQIVYLVYPGSKFVRTRIAYTRKSSLASCS